MRRIMSGYRAPLSVKHAECAARQPTLLTMARSTPIALNIGWQMLLQDFGLRPDAVLRRAGLPTDLLARVGQTLSLAEYFRFWRGIEQESQARLSQQSHDPLFALRLVEAVSAEVFDPPLYAALCSAHLMQAVQRLAQYKQLMAPMSLDLTVAGNGDLTIAPRWLTEQPASEVPASLVLAEVAFFVQLARLGTRDKVCATQVVLPSTLEALATLDGQHARRLHEFFGVAVVSGPSPSIRFAATDALRPFLTLNEGMLRVFEPELRRRLSELTATASTSERVRALLLDLLPSNTATIETVAERLGWSKRTLQRRLEDEGENFRALVNATREQLARSYLRNTALSSGEIGFLLGFEDPNSFYRAFQDWTGQTPEAVRHARTLN